jgi:hypothetical protein
MALERTHARIRSRRAVWAVARKRGIVNQTEIPPNQEIALGNYDEVDIPRVEPRGFEPLTSAVQSQGPITVDVRCCSKLPAKWRLLEECVS